MIDTKNSDLSVKNQCALLGLPRSNYYYNPVEQLKDKNDMDYLIAVEQINLKFPFYGYRRMNCQLNKMGIISTVKEARNAMRGLGISAIYPKPKLSLGNREHKKYPYLLKDLKIEYPNQVWASDITYIKHKGSFMYLSAIIDLYSRKILSWRFSNTMEVAICSEVLKDAVRNFGLPGIFNSDQGSQYTSPIFTDILEGHGIKISMDSKGRALDNVYIERFWRSLKYENIFINDYGTVKELRDGIKRYIQFYNTERFHQSLEYQTPDEVYYKNEKQAISQ